MNSTGRREDLRKPSSGFVIQINDTGERFAFSPLSPTDKIEFEGGQVLFVDGSSLMESSTTGR